MYILLTKIIIYIIIEVQSWITMLSQPKRRQLISSIYVLLIFIFLEISTKVVKEFEDMQQALRFVSILPLYNNLYYITTVI